MIRSCRLPWPIQDENCVSNVNEKTFTTQSHFHGVSCYNSAGNALGIAIDWIVLDEIQDLNLDFVPQIRETLRTSDYRWESYFGTARGIENTIQQLFDQSSGGEWVMTCRCKPFGFDIIPTKEHHAIAMVQKKGVCCPNCGRPIDVENGRWVHDHPDRAEDQYEVDDRGVPYVSSAGFAGYHIPATVVRDAITPHDRYLETIYNKLHGIGRYPEAKFLQEVLGISSDIGGRPITPQEIKEASVLDITPEFTGYNAEHYTQIAAGVDWGGAEVTSFTVDAVLGWHPSGKFHCLGASRPIGIIENERHLPIAAHIQKCSQGRVIAVGADAGFVGPVQNRNLQNVIGVPCSSIAYGTKKNFFTPQPGNNFIVDRTTLIYIAYTLIREGYLLFPKGAWFEEFTVDLTATIIEDMDTPNGNVVRRYARMKQRPDDFLHALGYAVFTLAVAMQMDLPAMLGLGTQASLNAGFIADNTAAEEGEKMLSHFGFTR